MTLFPGWKNTLLQACALLTIMSTTGCDTQNARSKFRTLDAAPPEFQSYINTGFIVAVLALLGLALYWAYIRKIHRQFDPEVLEAIQDYMYGPVDDLAPLPEEFKNTKRAKRTRSAALVSYTSRASILCLALICVTWGGWSGIRGAVISATAEQARVALAAGRFADAEKRYLEAWKCDPHSGDLQYMLGLTIERQKRYNDAANVFGILIAAEPHNVAALLHRAECLESANAPNHKCVDAYLRVLSVDNSNVEALFNLARVYDKAREYNSEIVLLHRLEHCEPDDAKVQLSLADVWINLGVQEEAVQHLQNAIRLDSVDPEVNRHAAKGFAACGQYGEAVNRLRDAMERDTDNPVDYLHLSKYLRNIHDNSGADKAFKIYMAVKSQTDAQKDDTTTKQINLRPTVVSASSDTFELISR